MKKATKYLRLTVDMMIIIAFTLQKQLASYLHTNWDGIYYYQTSF